MKYPDKIINKIIQGDCLDVMKKIPDNSIDCVVTDPPYGIDIGKNKTVGGGSHRGKAKDFGKSEWDKFTPTKEYFDEIIRISKNQIIFGGNYFTDKLPQSNCWLLWDKREGLPTRTFADGELIYTSFNSPLRIFRFKWDGMIQENMKQKEVRYHPTLKPVPLMRWIIENYTKENDLILDPFAGSGSTCVAAQNLHRRFIGIELEEKYCKIARERLRQ